jgi:heptosyltransferase-2
MEAIKKIIFWPTSPYITRLFGDHFFYHKGKGCNSRDISLTRVKRILVVRLDQIGDVAMTLPFLRELRRNLPDGWITLVVSPSALNLVEKCPYVNEVLLCGWEGDRDFHRFQRHWRAWKLAKKKLWSKQIDLAILSRRDTDSAHGGFLAYFSRAVFRVGYSDIAFGKKPPYFRNTDCLLTHILDSGSLKHEVEHSLEIIKYIGGKVESSQMEVWLSSEDKSFAEKILKSHNIQNNELLIAFALGAAHPKRIWPLSNFVKIGRWLEREYNARVIVLGSQKEEWLAKKVKRQMKGTVVDTVGRTTLRQAAAILRRCHLYVGNDSGLMHLSAASGIPVVEISCHAQNGLPTHPNSPIRFGPWGVPHRILQPKKAIPPCTDGCTAKEAHCIRDVTVERVKKNITDILSCQRQSKLYRNIIRSGLFSV